MRIIRKKESGFTLIELLLVIAIIAILALLIFIALDPGKRFKNSRDSRRFSDVNNIVSAIKVDQVDNGGAYFTNLESATVSAVYMIGTCTSNATSTAVTSYCTTDPTVSACLDVTDLSTDGYLGSIPISPNGSGSWYASTTGYTLTKASSGKITVRACEREEGSEEIELSR